MIRIDPTGASTVATAFAAAQAEAGSSANISEIDSLRNIFIARATAPLAHEFSVKILHAHQLLQPFLKIDRETAYSSERHARQVAAASEVAIKSKNGLTCALAVNKASTAFLALDKAQEDIEVGVDSAAHQNFVAAARHLVATQNNAFKAIEEIIESINTSFEFDAHLPRIRGEKIVDSPLVTLDAVRTVVKDAFKRLLNVGKASMETCEFKVVQHQVLARVTAHPGDEPGAAAAELSQSEQRRHNRATGRATAVTASAAAAPAVTAGSAAAASVDPTDPANVGDEDPCA